MSTDEPQDNIAAEQAGDDSAHYDLGSDGANPFVEQYVQNLALPELDKKLAMVAEVASQAKTSNHVASLVGHLRESKAADLMDVIRLPDDDRRAADASELTAKRLEVMVDAMLAAGEREKAAAEREKLRDEAAADRDRVVDQRERVMLRWTQASVVLAAVAAIAAIITLVIT